ncbi:MULTISPECIES: hypothetical protein [Bacillus]|uniref:hypothetical protein n=1 Tax=Bacillus TaxID=1386 RepID=UPI0015E09FA7|nr:MULTISPECIES: hypothetical protein [Bacillus]
MQNTIIGIMLLFILVAFGLHFLGLMKLIPVFISGPLLFISLLIFFLYLNERKKFKGF